MQLGVVFPQTRIGADVDAIRRFSQGVEVLGFEHILAYDHILGVDRSSHPGWDGPYDMRSTFHEPMVLFGYLAGVTSLELAAAVIILPQRQTALVAKQAAEVDVLCRGRLRLGVGVGWNGVEFEALGESFAERGHRMDEQIPLLRRFWCEPSVTHVGQYEQIRGLGIAPLPLQRPIPIWIGARSPRAYQRAGRLGDGWFPLLELGPELDQAKRIVDAAAEEAGRDPSAIGLERRINWEDDGGLERMVDDIGRWADFGATHLSVNTMTCDMGSADDHLAMLESVADRLGLGSSHQIETLSC